METIELEREQEQEIAKPQSQPETVVVEKARVTEIPVSLSKIGVD